MIYKVDNNSLFSEEDEDMNEIIPSTFSQFARHSICYCWTLLLALAAYGSAAAIGRPPTSQTAEKAGIDSYPSELFWPETPEWMPTPLLGSENAGRAFVEKVHSLRVASLEKGCGRMKNMLAMLEDGTRVCCRYRDNGSELRGEIFSYYLNGLLGLWNAVPATAVSVNMSSEQWVGVQEAATEAGWKDGAVIVMSFFVENTEEEYMLSPFKNDRSPTLTASHFTDVSLTGVEKRRLVQWSDMILFDFLIGHTDRLFNTLLNLQWNRRMMEYPVHNLKKTKSSSNLVLFDNESGLGIGFTAAQQNQEYYRLQSFFLKRLCAFRRDTIKALLELASVKGSPPSAVLTSYIQEVDPNSYAILPKWKTMSQTEFNSRVLTAQMRLDECAALVQQHS